MTVLRLDHTAVVVHDMEAALDRYRRLFGVEPSERTHVVDQQVEVAFLSFGDTQLELIRPLTKDSGVARYLESRGEGLHHVALLVDDIRTEMRRLSEEGADMVDRNPRRGAHGLIAFVHPRTTGVLLELIERD